MNSLKSYPVYCIDCEHCKTEGEGWAEPACVVPENIKCNHFSNVITTIGEIGESLTWYRKPKINFIHKQLPSYLNADNRCKNYKPKSPPSIILQDNA